MSLRDAAVRSRGDDIKAAALLYLFWPVGLRRVLRSNIWTRAEKRAAVGVPFLSALLVAAIAWSFLLRPGQIGLALGLSGLAIGMVAPALTAAYLGVMAATRRKPPSPE